MKKIFSITVKRMFDETPDTSFLGKYTDDLEPGVIVCRDNDFYEKLEKAASKEGREYELPERDREYRYFKPYAGGEKVGTKSYYEYGMKDYERMRGLDNADWAFVGVRAVAEVGVSTDGGKTWKLDKITSGGLWGIESDSGDYFKEVNKDELDALSCILKEYGFTASQIKAAMKKAEAPEEIVFR